MLEQKRELERMKRKRKARMRKYSLKNSTEKMKR